MRLREWFKANHVNVVAFGRKLGLSYPKSAYRYMSIPPKRVPRRHILDRITLLTGGKVTAVDFTNPPTEAELETPFVWENSA